MFLTPSGRLVRRYVADTHIYLVKYSARLQSGRLQSTYLEYYTYTHFTLEEIALEQKHFAKK